MTSRCWCASFLCHCIGCQLACPTSRPTTSAACQACQRHNALCSDSSTISGKEVSLPTSSSESANTPLTHADTHSSLCPPCRCAARSRLSSDQWLCVSGAVSCQAAGPYGRGLIDRYVTRRFPDSPVSALSEEVAEEVAAASADFDMAGAVPAMDKVAQAPLSHAQRSVSRTFHTDSMPASLFFCVPFACCVVLCCSQPAVSDYLYQMIVAPSSGDRALSLILKPGAFAHQPLADRLPTALAAEPSGRSVPTIFAYGTSDWMDRHAGAATAAAMLARGGAACSIRVREAGHQLMIDNPAGFKECVEAAMSFPSAEAGPTSRQQWAQRINATYKQLIIDT